MQAMLSREECAAKARTTWEKHALKPNRVSYYDRGGWIPRQAPCCYNGHHDQRRLLSRQNLGSVQRLYCRVSRDLRSEQRLLSIVVSELKFTSIFSSFTYILREARATSGPRQKQGSCLAGRCSCPCVRVFALSESAGSGKCAGHHRYIHEMPWHNGDMMVLSRRISTCDFCKSS